MENWPEFIQQHFATVPFFRFLSARVTNAERGRAQVVIPLSPEYANTYGITMAAFWPHWWTWPPGLPCGR
jgi:acyl-coenzyme A thioesterase PaaI-like protein